jgi:hypothetical protein
MRTKFNLPSLLRRMRNAPLALYQANNMQAPHLHAPTKLECKKKSQH